jgi:hypothetical protein
LEKEYQAIFSKNNNVLQKMRKVANFFVNNRGIALPEGCKFLFYAWGFIMNIQNALKSLNWKYLGLVLGLVFLFAIINNIRQPEERAVQWIGSQEILQEPEGF